MPSAKPARTGPWRRRLDPVRAEMLGRRHRTQSAPHADGSVAEGPICPRICEVVAGCNLCGRFKSRGQ